mmetsp:Transcript_23087/g.64014  ORF Transcript_23087/g.64014 Transcript_23087/m.64014 type:complete len:185 (-) Transcript_23087:826-1380(-)
MARSSAPGGTGSGMIASPTLVVAIAGATAFAMAAAIHRYYLCRYGFRSFARSSEISPTNGDERNTTDEEREKSHKNNDETFYYYSVNTDPAAKRELSDDPIVARFPWEQNYRPPPKSLRRKPTRKEDSSTTAMDVVAPTPNAAPVPCQSRSGSSITNVSDELDFLASMTFANGGLRSPSCPCCV